MRVQAGVRDVSISPWCTRCDNDRFFSHRAGDAGRQLGVIVAERGLSAALQRPIRAAARSCQRALDAPRRRRATT